MKHPRLALLFMTLSALVTADAQDSKQANYDEAKIAPYTLPPLLTCNDGSKVSSASRAPSVALRMEDSFEILA